jgi:hypothetical protein
MLLRKVGGMAPRKYLALKKSLKAVGEVEYALINALMSHPAVVKRRKLSPSLVSVVKRKRMVNSDELMSFCSGDKRPLPGALSVGA